jgi:hypothetical protein
MCRTRFAGAITPGSVWLALHDPKGRTYYYNRYVSLGMPGLALSQIWVSPQIHGCVAVDQASSVTSINRTQRTTLQRLAIRCVNAT